MDWCDYHESRNIDTRDLEKAIVRCLNASRDDEKKDQTEKLANVIDAYIDQKIKKIKVTVDNG